MSTTLRRASKPTLNSIRAQRGLLSIEPAAYAAFNSKIGPMVESQRRDVFRRRRDLMGAKQPIRRILE